MQKSYRRFGEDANGVTEVLQVERSYILFIVVQVHGALPFAYPPGVGTGFATRLRRERSERTCHLGSPRRD